MNHDDLIKLVELAAGSSDPVVIDYMDEFKVFMMLRFGDDLARWRDDERARRLHNQYSNLSHAMQQGWYSQNMANQLLGQQQSLMSQQQSLNPYQQGLLGGLFGI